MHLSRHHVNRCEYYILFTSWALWGFFFFFKAVFPRRQRSSHSVLLSTLCEPFNQYLSPISTWFSLLHHSIHLLLRDCRYLGVTFEIVRGLLVNVTDLLLCTHATLEKAVKRQMGEGGGSNERDWEREIMAEREKASRQTERKREIVCERNQI